MTQSTSFSPATPKQQIGLVSAVAIGTASMVGAGVFVVFRDAVLLAGPWFYLALFLAAVLASLNAAAVYQLAAQVAKPGGVYAYARKYLNETWSFIAGFSFVAGKIASIGAIGLVVASYLNSTFSVPLAIALILLLTALNIFGIQRTATAAKLISITVIGFFLVAILLGFGRVDQLNWSNLDLTFTSNPDDAFFATLSATSVLFFAFAGYARVATLGDDVINPKKNIPKAILISLILVVFLYAAIASLLILQLGSELLISEAPMASLFTNMGFSMDPVVSLMVSIAGLGSMLALLAGVSRTAAEMASDRELPQVFARKNRFGSPWLAELMVASGACVLVMTGQLIWVIGFSSFSVLLYYAVGQFSALRQPMIERTMPKNLNWLGLALALVVAISVPGPALLVSGLLLALVLGLRKMVRRA